MVGKPILQTRACVDSSAHALSLLGLVIAVEKRREKIANRICGQLCEYSPRRASKYLNEQQFHYFAQIVGRPGFSVKALAVNCLLEMLRNTSSIRAERSQKATTTEARYDGNRIQDNAC